MFTQNKGKSLSVPYSKTASTAFTRNDVVAKTTTSHFIKATSATLLKDLLGLMPMEVASTDSDYAANTEYPIISFHNPEASFRVTVDTGTATAAHEGKLCDLNDENGVNLDVVVHGHFVITKFISATEVEVKLNMSGKDAHIESFSQDFALADFTDGGAAVGTLVLDSGIPTGATILRTLITDVVGFAGDTSATVQVGDGSDVDRYSTGTPSVFASADAAVVGDPSGVKEHAAAKDVTVTITAGSDWGAVTAGSGTITLFYLVA